MKLKDRLSYWNQKLDRVVFDKIKFFYDALEKHFEMDKKRQKGKWYTKSIKDIVKK